MCEKKLRNITRDPKGILGGTVVGSLGVGHKAWVRAEGLAGKDPGEPVRETPAVRPAVSLGQVIQRPQNPPRRQRPASRGLPAGASQTH